MPNILVTGYKGYIGSHFIKPAPDLFQRCDIKDGRAYDFGIVSGFKFDVVVHLAASVSVMESFQKPDEYMENNAWKILRFLRNNQVGKFIFVSTGGAMYGNAHHASEDQASWSNCLSPYAQSKWMGEQIVRDMCQNYVILRLGNVFGGDYSVRGEQAAHAHFAEDNPIRVFGGSQTRDFVHIDVVCRALWKSIDDDIHGTFNIGSGKETSILQVAQEFSQQRNVPIEMLPSRSGEVETISLDITRAKNAGLI